MKGDDLGPCPLCGSPMIEGRSLDKHHLIPKSKKGRDSAELCHIVCHQKIHSTLTESELAHDWYTWEVLRTHPEIEKYIAWVRKRFQRDPEFKTHHRDTKARKRKRR